MKEVLSNEFISLFRILKPWTIHVNIFRSTRFRIFMFYIFSCEHFFCIFRLKGAIMMNEWKLMSQWNITLLQIFDVSSNIILTFFFKYINNLYLFIFMMKWKSKFFIEKYKIFCWNLMKQVIHLFVIYSEIKRINITLIILFQFYCANIVVQLIQIFSNIINENNTNSLKIMKSYNI